MSKLNDFISFTHKCRDILPTFWRIRKFGRFIKRLFLWIPTIYRIESWDYEYLIDLMVLQLKGMEVALRNDTMTVGASLRARQIRIVLEHIKHYKDIDKYVEHVPHLEYFSNEYLIPARDNCLQLCYKDEVLHHYQLLIDKRAMELEDWHLKETWRLISKQIRGWWT